MLLATAYKTYSEYFDKNYAEFNAAANMDKVAGGAWNIGIMVLCFAMVLTIGYFVIKMIISDSTGRADAKKHIPVLLILFILAFGAIVLIQTVFDVGSMVGNI